MNEIGLRVKAYILKGDVAMIKGLLDLGFLSATSDVYDFTGNTNSNNPEDCYLAIELIASSRDKPIPNYKEMIDLFLANGAGVDDHAGAITPLEMAIIQQNYAVAAYLQLKGGTYNVEEVTEFSRQVGIDLIAGINADLAN